MLVESCHRRSSERRWTSVLAPSSSGPGRRPLKAVAGVRIPSGLPRKKPQVTANHGCDLRFLPLGAQCSGVGGSSSGSSRIPRCPCPWSRRCRGRRVVRRGRRQVTRAVRRTVSVVPGYPRRRGCSDVVTGWAGAGQRPGPGSFTQGYCVVGLTLVTASIRSLGRWLAHPVARAMLGSPLLRWNPIAMLRSAANTTRPLRVRDR